MSQKATKLLRVLDHMHAYERYGREIPDDPRIVQRLNQLHHDLAYGDIPEVECPTVIEFVKDDEDFPRWNPLEHTFFFYDDNGVLRKIVSGMPFLARSLPMKHLRMFRSSAKTVMLGTAQLLI